MNTKQKLAVLFIVIMAALTSASCSKESVPQPQKITYEVWCDNCYIFLEDDDINRNVVDQLHEYKNFNVSGYFRYEFINNRGIDVVFATVLVSVYYPHDQRIVVRITDSEAGNVKEVSKNMTSLDSERISFEMEI